MRIAQIAVFFKQLGNCIGCALLVAVAAVKFSGKLCLYIIGNGIFSSRSYSSNSRRSRLLDIRISIDGEEVV